jgi:hypothetical protein
MEWRFIKSAYKQEGCVTRKKCHETAKKNLENHERWCTAGLLASSGHFNLGTNVLEHQRHSRQIEEEKHHPKALCAKAVDGALHVKVHSRRKTNRQNNGRSLNWIQWYNGISSLRMQQCQPKKGEKLARYHEIKSCGDPPEPQLLEQPIPPLPPLLGSELDPNMSEENGNTSEPNDAYDCETLIFLAVGVW